jgi:outer membrane protein TolC
LSTPEITPAAAEIANSFPATRADFKAMEKGIESYDLMITATKKSYLPRLNAFANYQLNDNRMLGFGAGSYLAGVQLSWDIFKGNRVKESMAIQKLEKSKLQQKLQQEKDQSQLAINQSQRNLAQAKIQLQQQAVSVEQAEEALRVTRNRYAQGLITTNDVLMAQTQLSQQKLMKAQANFQAQLATISLQFFTATTK